MLLSWSKVHSLEPVTRDWILHKSNKSHPAHPNVPCSMIFRKNEPCYRCLTCGLDETCALCADCFVEDDHIGHEVYLSICSRDIGGVCDCGDSEAWYRDLHCKHHETTEVDEKDIPEDFKDAIFETLECILDYVIDVLSLSCAESIPINTMPETIIESSNSTKLSFSKYGGDDENSKKFYLVLFNDQTKHYTDAVNRIKLATMKVPEFAEMVAKQCHKNGRAIVMGSDNLPFLLQRKAILDSTGLCSCIKSYRDYFREEMCAEIVNWLSDITKGPIGGNHRLVHKLFCKALCCKWQEGVVPPEHNILGQYIPGRLQDNKIPVYPTLVGHDANPKDYYWKSLASSEVIDKEGIWDMTSDICEECDYDPKSSAINHDPIHGSRLQYLLVFDHRFWKTVRISLHEIYVSAVVSNINYKSLMACQYADIYPLLVEIFLVFDREYDWAFLCNLSVQLFTCPTNATMLSKHGEVKKLLAVAYGFLTKGHAVFNDPSVYKIENKKLPLVSLTSLKVRRWNQLFFDIAYILQRNEEPSVFFESDFVSEVCDLLILFHGLPVAKRESVEHVEYETTDYPLYFNGVSIIANFSKLIVKSAHKLKNRTEIIKPVISIVLNRYLSLVNDSRFDTANKEFKESDEQVKKLEITDVVFFNKFKTIKILGIKETVLEFRVDKELISFLHPLSTYLSYLIENSGIDDPSFFRNLFSQTVIEETPTIESNSPSIMSQIEKNQKNIWSIIVDYSLRTIVLLSQIKVGFWVRNGYSARSQYHNYRNLGLREYGFHRDIYLLQCFCALQDNTDNIVGTIIDRWGLLSWVDEQYDDVNIYGTTQTLHFMVEEILDFFIVLMECNDHLLGLNDKEINEIRLTKDMIHYLCFKPLTYTELTAELPDHITSDRRFEFILNKVADYIMPASTTTNGRYKLKDEYLDQVNPYYVHYTSNKRDDALKLVRDRQLVSWKSDSELMAKNISEKLNYNDTYYEPKPIEYTSLYKSLCKFSCSLYFIQFLKSTLNFILINHHKQSEIITNLCLQLIHVCVVNDKDDEFSEFCFTELDTTDELDEPQSIASLLFCILIFKNPKNNNVVFESCQSKIKAIFKDLQGKFPLKNDYFRQKYFDIFSIDNISSTIENELRAPTNSAGEAHVLTDAERKKTLAAERKAKILAAFKKQQSKFVENNQEMIEEFNDHNNHHHHRQDDIDMNEENLNGNNKSMIFDDEIDSRPGWKFPEESCILCQMPAEKEYDAFGILTFVGDSSVFRNVPFDDDYWICKAYGGTVDLDEEVEEPDYKHPRYHHPRYHKQQIAQIRPTPTKVEAYIKSVEKEVVIGPGFPNNDSYSVVTHPITTSCGHGMHLSCFKEHLKATEKRVNHFTRTLPEDFTNNEFICPLCKAINNTIVPVLSDVNNVLLSKYLEPSIKYPWYKPFEEFDQLSIEKSLNYEPNIYDEFKSKSLKTMQSNFRSIFFNDDINSKNFKEFYNNYCSLNDSFCYITLSYFKENISDLIAHTIESIEISLRGVPYTEDIKKPMIIYQLSHRDISTLRVWSQYRNHLVMLNIHKSLASSGKSNFEIYPNLSTSFSNLKVESKIGFNNEKDWIDQTKDGDIIIEHFLGLLKLLSSKEIFTMHNNIDIFELLVSILPIDYFEISFNSILRMSYLIEILRIGFVLVSKFYLPLRDNSKNFNLLDLPIIEGLTEEDSLNAENFFMKFKSIMIQNNVDDDHIINDSRLGSVFYSIILKSLTPFLRKCSIWSFVNAANDDINITDELNEPDKLCEFLKLPNFKEMMNLLNNENSFESKKLQIFCEKTKIEIYSNKNNCLSTKNNLQIKYPNKIELINLPSRMDFFFTSYIYPKYNNDLSYDPAVCLFCGKMVELQESIIGFPKNGECNLHYQAECLNDCGLFLLPKHGSILMLYNGNGSFFDAPYYDQHGELPKDSRNGHPLHLNTIKYREFMKNIWLQHNIPNYITRKLESSVDIGGWETL